MSGSGDYISREAAFNTILKLVPKVDDDGYCWVIRGDAATALDSIPAADVRPVRRGMWEYNPGDNIPYCSECMMPQDSECNFCPNCGADMREES